MTWPKRPRIVWLATATLLLAGAACLAASPAARSAIAGHAPFAAAVRDGAAKSEVCAVAAGAEPVRYDAVAPVFEKHCNRCHDSRQSDNLAARRVFESSSYPFSTERPDALLVDLGKMFESRGGLTDEDRCVAMRWLNDGGLDQGGAKPTWRR